MFDIQRLNDIRERWRKAKPAPWYWDDVNDPPDREEQPARLWSGLSKSEIARRLRDYSNDNLVIDCGADYCGEAWMDASKHDAEAIAASPADIAFLLSVVDAQAERIKELESSQQKGRRA